MTQSTNFLAELAPLAEGTLRDPDDYSEWARVTWDNRYAILALGSERDALAEALRVIAYDGSEQPWRVAHDALKYTVVPIALEGGDQ